MKFFSTSRTWDSKVKYRVIYGNQAHDYLPSAHIQRSDALQLSYGESSVVSGRILGLYVPYVLHTAFLINMLVICNC